LTSFSPSPIHLLVSEELEIEKKVAPDSWAMAFPIRVFPVLWCAQKEEEEEKVRD